MAIYIVVPLINTSEPLDNAVKEHFPSEADRFKLQADRGWLINYEGTSIELSNKLKITGQPQGEKSPVGSAIIVPISTYFGRGPGEMWEWLKTRIEK